MQRHGGRLLTRVTTAAEKGHLSPLGVPTAYFGFPTIGTNRTGSVRSVSSPVSVLRRILSSCVDACRRELP